MTNETTTEPSIKRCPWCEGFELYRHYHDTEWGVPVRDDRTLFELLILEGAQAGLSWATVLKKRENYRQAFDGFVPEIIAKYEGRIEVESSPGKGSTFNIFIPKKHLEHV